MFLKVLLFNQWRYYLHILDKPAKLTAGCQTPLTVDRNNVYTPWEEMLPLNPTIDIWITDYVNLRVRAKLLGATASVCL